MRLLLALFLTLPLAAQTAASQPQDKKAEPAQKQAEAKEEAAQTPVKESWLTGSMELGYRVRTNVTGNFNSYRSVVNLGEGPKLFGMDFVIQDSSRRLFDKVSARASSWGGDPYNTAHVDVSRDKSYNLSVDYRNISYFNFLPSFANPAIDRGLLNTQHGFDLQRRTLDAQLDLLPGRRVVPYLAYGRDWGTGSGITTFVTETNEYAVADRLRDKTDDFRGGVRFEFQRFHLTLEQGGTKFKDDQSVYNAERTEGNRSTPFFGQQLFLTGLQQAYRVRGDSMYSKGLVTASPASWVNFYGQFLYSRPTTDMKYSAGSQGRFGSLNPPAGNFRFYDAAQSLLTAEAKQPHTSGNVGIELRPFSRLRVIESVMTDRFHATSAAVLQEGLLSGTTRLDRTLSGPDFNDRLVFNYNRQEVNALFDITSHITLRGGHRFVWGDTQVRARQLLDVPAGTLEGADLRQHVGLAGLSARAGQKFSVNFDFEGSSADRTYFRTSLHDYRKIRARAKYQLFQSLSFAANFSYLENENPDPSIRYDFLNRDNSFSLFWTPAGGKRITIVGDYTRSTLRSDLGYRDPSTGAAERSFYQDSAHIATALLDLNLPAVNGASPKVSLGGSLFVSSRSRASEFYQPLAKISFPLHKNVHVFGEWRWYEFSERFYLYEGFRTHLFMTGIRLAK